MSHVDHGIRVCSFLFALTVVAASCGDAGAASNGGGTGGAGGASLSGSGGTGGGAGGGASGDGAATGGAVGSATAGATGTDDGGQTIDAPAVVDSAGTGAASGDASRDAGAHPFACPPGPFATPQPGAAHAVCAGVVRYVWNEGPTWVARQAAFFFTNFINLTYNNGDLIKYTPSTGLCEIYIKDIRCNGLAATNDGNIIGACQDARAVVKYDLDTKRGTVLASMAEGQLLGQPNDLIQASDDSIYFTSPAVRPGRPAGLESAVLRIDPLGAVSVIIRGTGNGIGLSPDEKRLYVVGQGVFDLSPAGAVSNKRAFNLGGDGIAVDCAGNVYDNGGGITSPQGQRTGTFPGGTNMAFGGPDGKSLLVVANRDARIVDMNIPGLP